MSNCHFNYLNAYSLKVVKWITIALLSENVIQQTLNYTPRSPLRKISLEIFISLNKNFHIWK